MGRSRCTQCGREYDGPGANVAVAVHSPRIAEQHIFPLCSRACRAEWWAAPTAGDLVRYVDSPSSDDPGEIHAGDKMVAVYRQHLDDQGSWEDVEAVVLEDARGINPYWQAPPHQDPHLKIVPVRASRSGGRMRLLEPPPPHWIGFPVEPDGRGAGLPATLASRAWYAVTRAVVYVVYVFNRLRGLLRRKRR